jgi:pimeloyl-ACP methyl ester carboxylesterase/DNA-binding CsgD family transcriptional regulator
MSRQRIRYLRTPDGVQLAWATAGSGPALVKAAHWLSHLEQDWRSPVWRHWMEFLAGNFTYVRYDERGCGMTDWKVGELSFERWVDDLERVVEAAGLSEPFVLLGISQGAAICVAYAVRHPERVSHLVLYGGYSKGWTHRPDSPGRREYQAIVELTRSGWGKDNPAYRQLFTSRFVPGGSAEQLDWWNELCRTTTTPAIAAELLQARADVDASHLLAQVRTPTLVVHAREDQVCPLSAGRGLASGIPGAEFVELDSRNHVLLESEPAWERFKEVLLGFVGLSAPSAGEDPVFARLSAREREILTHIAEGLANAGIGRRLSISEKTVRNHVSNLFQKLGVGTRAQAMVFAREHGFRA